MIINALQCRSCKSWHERDSYHRSGPFGVSFKDSSPKTNTELITEKHLTGTHQKPIRSSAQPPGTPGFDQDLNVSKACEWEGKAQIKDVLQKRNCGMKLYPHNGLNWSIPGWLAGVPKPKNCPKHRPRWPLWVDILCQRPKSPCGSWPAHIDGVQLPVPLMFQELLCVFIFFIAFMWLSPSIWQLCLPSGKFTRNEGENTHVSSQPWSIRLLAIPWTNCCLTSDLFPELLRQLYRNFLNRSLSKNRQDKSPLKKWDPNLGAKWWYINKNDMKLSESNYNFIHKKTRLWDILKSCRALHSLHDFTFNQGFGSRESIFCLQLLGCYTYLWRDVRFSSPEIYILCSLHITPVSLLYPVHFFMLLSALSGCTASCSIMSSIA